MIPIRRFGPLFSLCAVLTACEAATVAPVGEPTGVELLPTHDADAEPPRASWTGHGRRGDDEGEPMDPALRAVLVERLQRDAGERYAFSVRASAGALLTALHPSQDLRVEVERDGALVLGDRAGHVPVRISLARLGGHDVGPSSPRALGARLELARGDVTEWYQHGPLGLEQGFTLARPPGGELGTLVVEVRVEAEGYARATGEDGTLELVRGTRTIVVRDLYAHDADGRTLASRMSWTESGLRLEVDAAGARYPVVIDPVWSERERLVASDATAESWFGTAVALSGDTVVVGASNADCAEGSDCGAAYVFERSGSTWAEQRLVPSDPQGLAYFGRSVAVSGDTLVVGAPQGSGRTGAAYVFVRRGTSWVEQQRLLASDAVPGVSFGDSVAISGDTVVVGAQFHGCASGSALCGTAYVFVRSDGAWREEQRLVPSDPGWGNFGFAVGVSGDTAVVTERDGPCPGGYCGAAHVFVRSGGAWSEQQRLQASVAMEGSFGLSVAVAEDTVLIGAVFAGCAAGPDCGAAYVFERSGSTWTEQQRLVASDANADDWFGWRVALYEDTALVGAPSVDCAAGRECGAAYVFERSGSTWTEQQKLVIADAEARDTFGDSVALSEGRMVIGVPGADCRAGTSCGAAYVFADSPCGNGVLESGEECDRGACCSASCTIQPSSFECRPSAGACDIAEACSGSSVDCPADEVVAAATECRPMTHACDVAEACDGVDGRCPVDALDLACECGADADCADTDACTVDACDRPSGSDVGHCTHTPIAACVPDAGTRDAGLPDDAAMRDVPDAAVHDAPDAGTTGAPAGCGCRVGGAGPSGTSPAWWLVLAAALAARRRR